MGSIGSPFRTLFFLSWLLLLLPLSSVSAQSAQIIDCENAPGIVVRGACPGGFQQLTSGVVLSDDERCCALPNRADICSLSSGELNSSFCSNDCSSGTRILDARCSCPSGNLCVSSASQGAITTLSSRPPQSGSTPGGSGGGNPQPSGSQQIVFNNPLQYDTVEQVLGSILSTLRAIIVVLSLVFIVIGAIMYITSSGDEGRMKTAKGAITASMIGLAIGIAAPSFLKEIGNILGWNSVNSDEVQAAKTLTQIASDVLKFLLSIVGILGIVMLVVGGMMYLTAAGDEDRIDTGKKIVKYAIIGILVSLASLVLVSQITSFFI